MSILPLWAQAELWSLCGGSALVVGTALAYLVSVPRRVTACILAFGCADAVGDDRRHDDPGGGRGEGRLAGLFVVLRLLTAFGLSEALGGR